MPCVLDRFLLDVFEARLRALGLAAGDAWAPGLTDDQIDALIRPVGITLPEEARVWWRWHDGVRAESPPKSWDIMPGRSVFSLKETLELYVAERDRMRDDGLPEVLLNPVSRHPIILFHCAGPDDAPVPIYVLDDWSDSRLRPALSSIGELVQTWIGYLDAGLVKSSAEGGWETEQLCDLSPSSTGPRGVLS